MEILNVFIVLIQFAMTNTFLHFRFIGYGIDVSILVSDSNFCISVVILHNPYV